MSLIISHPEDYATLTAKFRKDGAKKFHVVADFDKTLTSPFVNGVAVPSVISLLRDRGYISPDYSEKAKALANHYHAIEVDLKIPEEKRREAMQEWWTKHFDLLIQSGLNKKHLERIVNEEGLEFRKGALEFLDLMHEKDVPVIILSSSGLGDTIEMLLERERRMYDNIYVITNRFDYTDAGTVLGVKRPIIHSMNKDETSLKNMPTIAHAVKGRKNVLLLGDGIGDLGMVAGFKYSGLIKVGFLEDKPRENLSAYQQAFDMVLTDNSSFEEINKLVKEIK